MFSRGWVELLVLSLLYRFINSFLLNKLKRTIKTKVNGIKIPIILEEVDKAQNNESNAKFL